MSTPPYGNFTPYCPVGVSFCHCTQPSSYSNANFHSHQQRQFPSSPPFDGMTPYLFFAPYPSAVREPPQSQLKNRLEIQMLEQSGVVTASAEGSSYTYDPYKFAPMQRMKFRFMLFGAPNGLDVSPFLIGFFSPFGKVERILPPTSKPDGPEYVFEVEFRSVVEKLKYLNDRCQGGKRAMIYGVPTPQPWRVELQIKVPKAKKNKDRREWV